MDHSAMIELYEFNKYLSIQGFTDVRIPNITAFFTRIRTEIQPNPIQVLDASFVAGEKHLLFAVLNALNAFEQGQNISESLDVEVLLYASGQRQIRKAIEQLGLKPATSEIAVAAIAATKDEVKGIEAKVAGIVPGKREDKVLCLQEGKAERLMEAFDITDTELEVASENRETLWEALVGIIIERSALLAINR
jgi:KEOPS complex subunit Cgi121